MGDPPHAGGYSTVEFGWTVDPSLNNDSLPRLFVYHFDNGAGTCYNACGFVANPGSPPINSPVAPNPPGVGYQYGMLLQGTQWWLYYNGYWMGYYPSSAWAQWFPSYVTRLEAGGEIASSNAWRPLSHMGNGYYGSNPLGYPAMWHQVWRTRQPYPGVSEYLNPNLGGYYLTTGDTTCAYNQGNWYPQYGQFSYGGIGFGPC